MNDKNYAKVPKGTVINVPDLRITATVKQVLYSECFGGLYDIEFIDSNDKYRHYKQWDDGGTVIFPKKRYVDYYGIDCTDLFEKYGY